VIATAVARSNVKKPNDADLLIGLVLQSINSMLPLTAGIHQTANTRLHVIAIADSLSVIALLLTKPWKLPD
jgi:hypothetical protein